MTTSSDSSDPWQLQSHSAVLRLQQFSATVDLLRPSRGLAKLSYLNQSLDGFVLAVSPADEEAIASHEVSDAFVRGNDLVVTYAETEQRPFTLQVYWRVRPDDSGVVVLDAILSLQTRLLESFPQVQVATEIPAVAAKLLSTDPDADQTQASLLDLANGELHELPTDESNGVLLRSDSEKWSFAEATHPQDRGVSQVDASQPAIRLTHQLGGRFMEKGVIRRLRVRSVFMPREKDTEVASHYLASLKTEQPPLTV